MLRTVFLLTLVIGGAGAGAYYGGVIDKPTYGVVDIGDWGEVSDDAVEIVSTVWIHNPNPAGLNITDVKASYRVALNGVTLAEGKKNGVAINKGNNTKKIRTSLVHVNVPKWWAAHMQNDEQSTVEARGNIYIGFLPTDLEGLTYELPQPVSTNIEGMLDQTVANMEGTYEGPGVTIQGVSHRPAIEIRGGSAAFGRVTAQETPIRLTFNVHNPNPYPVPTPELDGNLRMNDIRVAEWTANDIKVLNAPENGVILPKQTRELTFIITMQNDQVDDWFVTHVEQEEYTAGEITARLAFTLEGVTLYVPQDEGITCNFAVQTAFLADDKAQRTTFDGCESAAFDEIGIDYGSEGSGNGSSSSGTDDGTTGDGSGEDTDSDGGSGSDSPLDGLTGGIGGN